MFGIYPKDIVREGTEKASKITPSVLTLARVLGVKAVDLASAVYNVEDETDFMADFTGAMIKAHSKAVKEERKAKRGR